MCMKYICTKEGAIDRRQSEGKGRKKMKKDGASMETSKAQIDGKAPLCRQGPMLKNFGYRYDSYTLFTTPHA